MQISPIGFNNSKAYMYACIPRMFFFIPNILILSGAYIVPCYRSLHVVGVVTVRNSHGVAAAQWSVTAENVLKRHARETAGVIGAREVTP